MVKHSRASHLIYLNINFTRATLRYSSYSCTDLRRKTCAHFTLYSPCKIVLCKTKHRIPQSKTFYTYSTKYQPPKGPGGFAMVRQSSCFPTNVRRRARIFALTYRSTKNRYQHDNNTIHRFRTWTITIY